MTRKSIILLSLLILSPLIIYFLWPSDESRIKKLFREGAEAVESEKTDDVMGKVSLNYRDEYGLTYIYIKKVLETSFQKMNDIDIDYKIVALDIHDATAAVDIDVRVIASRGVDTGYFLGNAAKPQRLSFALEKVRTKWLVNSVSGLPLDF